MSASMGLRRVGGRGSRTAILALLLVGAGLHASANDDSADTLTLRPCRLPGLPHDARCGILKRPLDPAHPSAFRFDLHVAVLPALARQKKPDPIFFFAGGPGQSAIDLAGTVERLMGRLGTRRDIVLIDQRGTGRSAPLYCEQPTAATLADTFDTARKVAAMERCRVALQKLPWGDLRQFTTTVAMTDAEAVRVALGAEKINLVGASYGTRAALEYLRGYPAHVRRVVMDGIVPPDMALPATFGIDAQSSFDAMMRDCLASAECASAYPNLETAWQRLLASLPRRVENLADPESGLPVALNVDREMVLNLVRPALYLPALGAALPHAITQAADGRFAPLAALGLALGSSGPEIAEGEHFSVICAEDVPPAKPGKPGSVAAAASSEALYRDVCAHWPRGEVPAAFHTIPLSAAPTLMLSGALDPATPPGRASHVAHALGPRAVHVVAPNVGHGVMGLPCVHDAIGRFIDAPDDAAAHQVDLSCLAGIPRPPAFRPVLPARAASAPNEVRGFTAVEAARP